MQSQLKKLEKIEANAVWTLAQLKTAFKVQGADVVDSEFVGFDTQTILVLITINEQAAFLRAVIDRSGLNDAYTMPECNLPVITAAAIEIGTLDPWTFVEGLGKL